MGQKRAILEDEEAGPFKVATKRVCEQRIASERSDPDSNDSGHGLVNRCFGCRRKVGLMGFRCRCGDVFCWEHRYSDRHDCDFDYKEAGRVVIARENPVIRPVKVLKV